MNQVPLNFDKEGVKIAKSDEVNFIAAIEVTPEIQNNIDMTVDKDIRDQVKNLIETYEPVKTKTTDIELNISLKNDKPVFLQPPRLPHYERDIVQEQIHQWLNEGKIRLSSSEYASPVLVTKREDGSHRVCMDYRQLNAKNVKRSISYTNNRRANRQTKRCEYIFYH